MGTWVNMSRNLVLYGGGHYFSAIESYSGGIFSSLLTADGGGILYSIHNKWVDGVEIDISDDKNRFFYHPEDAHYIYEALNSGTLENAPTLVSTPKVIGDLFYSGDVQLKCYIAIPSNSPTAIYADRELGPAGNALSHYELAAAVGNYALEDFLLVVGASVGNSRVTVAGLIFSTYNVKDTNWIFPCIDVTSPYQSATVSIGTMSDSSSYSNYLNTKNVDVVVTGTGSDSEANGVLSGIVARLRHDNPDWNAWDARAAIRMASSNYASGWQPVSGSTPNVTGGYGEIDKSSHTLFTTYADFNKNNLEIQPGMLEISDQGNHLRIRVAHFKQAIWCRTHIVEFKIDPSVYANSVFNPVVMPSRITRTFSIYKQQVNEFEQYYDSNHHTETTETVWYAVVSEDIYGNFSRIEIPSISESFILDQADGEAPAPQQDWSKLMAKTLYRNVSSSAIDLQSDPNASFVQLMPNIADGSTDLVPANGELVLAYESVDSDGFVVTHSDPSRGIEANLNAPVALQLYLVPIDILSAGPFDFDIYMKSVGSAENSVSNIEANNTSWMKMGSVTIPLGGAGNIPVLTIYDFGISNMFKIVNTNNASLYSCGAVCGGVWYSDSPIEH